MVIVEDHIQIDRPAETVFEWFDHFADDYVSWHNRDHVTARWVKGKNFEEGSILYSEEYLGGKFEKISAKVTKKVENRSIEYRFLFPTSMICSGGSFNVEPSNGGSVFTAKLYFRFGKLLSKVYPSRLDAIRKHMKEEGENLKKLLENKSC